jgi:hypothetical protein
MFSRFRGDCLDCGFSWDGLCSSTDCGPINARKPETYRRYYCPRCSIELNVSRRLSRSAWLRWVSENASEVSRSPLLLRACEHGVSIDLQALQVIARSPLLFDACERVSRSLACASSLYVPIPIDIGTIACGDCGDPMTVGCCETSALMCPRCETPSARSLGDHRAERILVDYVPPVEDDVRRVVRHLTELAANREVPEFKKSRALPTPPRALSLWDSALDG